MALWEGDTACKLWVEKAEAQKVIAWSFDKKSFQNKGK